MNHNGNKWVEHVTAHRRRGKENEVFCYQEFRMHRRKQRQIAMRRSASSLDTVRDWYTAARSPNLNAYAERWARSAPTPPVD